MQTSPQTQTGSAWSEPQFRLFFLGAFFSVQGIWVQRVTLAWIAWERTGSAGFVGLVAALGLLPSLVSGPVFGVMADRVNVRHAAIATNTGMVLCLLALALALPWIGPAGIAAVALAIGIVISAHHPVRMSLGPRLVPAEMAGQVVAATAINFNIARLVAPAATGWVIATAGAQTALWLGVACYVPMLVVLTRLRARPLPPRPRRPFLRELADGVRFVLATPPVRQAFVTIFVFAVTVRGALEVLPVLADGAFGRGAAGLGVLTAAAGAGALAAAGVRAFTVRRLGAQLSGRLLLLAVLGQGAVVAMGLAPSWTTALAAVTLVGFCATWVGVTTQAAVQNGLPDDLRGRVMSLWTVVGFGTVALGAFFIGALADAVAIGPALAVAGGVGILAQIASVFGSSTARTLP